jgi:hypothetical protein
MPHTRFANVCPVLIVVLLGVIALRRDVTPAYAAQRFSYEVIRVDEHDIAAKVAWYSKDFANYVRRTLSSPDEAL